MVMHLTFYSYGVPIEAAEQKYDPTQGEKIVITYGDEGSLTQPQVMAGVWAINKIQEETGGRISFEHYVDGVLGTGAQLLQQVMDGTIQVGDVSVGLFSPYIPTMQALQLPFLLNNYEKERAALNSPEFKALLDSLGEIGIKAFSVGECGMRHFAHASKPINTVDDMKGVKIRIVPSNMLQDAMTLLGANPVPLAYGEVYSALQNKVIDALEINLMSMNTMKFYEVIKNFSYIGLYPFPTIFSMNKDFFDSLTPEDQALIEKWFKEAQNYDFETSLPMVEEASLKIMIDNGVVTNEIADIDSFRQLMLPVYEAYAAQDSRIKNFIEMAVKLK
jgi:tripartite ATP-independent transporter DctP family solute receptor